MEEAADLELYERWAGGDNGAGSALVDRHLERIGRFFANKVADATDTEDLTGQTFEVCLRNLGRFRGESTFTAYLYGIARNVLRDYIKKKRRRTDPVDFRDTIIADLGPSPSVVLGERKEQSLLLNAMRAIPLDFQIVLELSFFEEMTQAEIADILGVPPGTVASRIRRGKNHLLKQIETLAETPALLESTLHGLEHWIAKIRAQLGEGTGHASENGDGH